MSSFTIRIENQTHSTPDLQNIVLTNCQWLFTQELYDTQPIAPQGLVQGTVEPNVGTTYQGTLKVHYYYMPPGPGGADVKLQFGVESFDGLIMPFIGAVTKSNALDLDWEILTIEDHDFVGILRIRQV